MPPCLLYAVSVCRIIYISPVVAFRAPRPSHHTVNDAPVVSPVKPCFCRGRISRQRGVCKLGVGHQSVTCVIRLLVGKRGCQGRLRRTYVMQRQIHLFGELSPGLQNRLRLWRLRDPGQATCASTTAPSSPTSNSAVTIARGRDQIFLIVLTRSSYLILASVLNKSDSSFPMSSFRFCPLASILRSARRTLYQITFMLQFRLLHSSAEMGNAAPKRSLPIHILEKRYAVSCLMSPKKRVFFSFLLNNSLAKRSNTSQIPPTQHNKPLRTNTQDQRYRTSVTRVLRVRQVNAPLLDFYWKIECDSAQTNIL